jgi:hypothetical protein
MSKTLDNLVTRLERSTPSPRWDHSNFVDPQTANLLGDSRFEYVPFYKLSRQDQEAVRRSYPYKNEGRWGGFLDEHYYYPVTKKGKLASARRELAIPHRLLNDTYMATLGYRPR